MRTEKNVQRTDHIFGIRTTHNAHMEHDANKIAPKETRKPKSQLGRRLKNDERSAANRIYSPPS